MSQSLALEEVSPRDDNTLGGEAELWELRLGGEQGPWH